MPKLGVRVFLCQQIRPQDWNGGAFRPFLEISFDGQRCRTSVKEEHTDPIWNEVFSFKISNLNNLDNLHLNISAYSDDVYLGGLKIGSSEFGPESEALLLSRSLKKDGISANQLLTFSVYIVEDEINDELSPSQEDLQFGTFGQFSSPQDSSEEDDIAVLLDSEEYDVAVSLEAAIFGGTGSESYHSWSAPQPPSLQADRAEATPKEEGKNVETAAIADLVKGHAELLAIMKSIAERLPQSTSRSTTSIDNEGPPQESIKCSLCNSTNAELFYYNNYIFTQPRYLCKTCRKYWTEVGSSSASSSSSSRHISQWPQGWVRANEGKVKMNEGNLHTDEVSKPVDPLSKQRLDCRAADLAIEEVIYSLDKAFQEGSVPFDQYMKNIRALSREQYFYRATILKVRDEQKKQARLPKQHGI